MDDDVITPLFDEQISAELLRMSVSQPLIPSTPRQAGKNRLRTSDIDSSQAPPGTVYRQATDDYQLPSGSIVTRQQMQQRYPSAFSQPPAQGGFGYLPDREEELKPLAAVRWLESKRFTYMALWVHETRRWYVTGQGVHYGGNELTHMQLLEIMDRPSVTVAETVAGWRALR